jgi:hypothetical protein
VLEVNLEGDLRPAGCKGPLLRGHREPTPSPCDA